MTTDKHARAVGADLRAVVLVEAISDTDQFGWR